MIYDGPAKRSLLNGYILLLIATAPPYKLTTLAINGEKCTPARRPVALAPRWDFAAPRGDSERFESGISKRDEASACESS